MKFLGCFVSLLWAQAARILSLVLSMHKCYYFNFFLKILRSEAPVNGFQHADHESILTLIATISVFLWICYIFFICLPGIVHLVCRYSSFYCFIQFFGWYFKTCTVIFFCFFLYQIDFIKAFARKANSHVGSPPLDKMTSRLINSITIHDLGLLILKVKGQVENVQTHFVLHFCIFELCVPKVHYLLHPPHRHFCCLRGFLLQTKKSIFL